MLSRNKVWLSRNKDWLLRNKFGYHKRSKSNKKKEKGYL